LKTFLENIVFKHQKQVVCLGIFLVNRNEWKISLIKAGISHNEINIESVVEDVNELKEAGEVAGKSLPVVLNIDGWGVLIKDSSTDNSSIPIDNNEFIVKEYPKPDGNGAYFSIIRTDLLKSILDFCRSASLNIIGISMGPFNVALLTQFFENCSEIMSGKWKLNLNKGSIESLNAEGIENETVYDIGGDKVTSGLLPLYATVVSFFSGERGDNYLITGTREEFVYGRLVKYLSIGSLSVILILLLLNYFIWDSLRNRDSELAFEVTRNEQLLSQLSNKEKELKEKENLVIKYIGTNAKSHYAWYADRLGSSVPIGIRLSLMDIQPLNKKQKPGIAMEYKNKEIEVEGDAKNMSDISEWVKAIGNEKWAKKVELISFFTDKEEAVGHFKLQIKY
jgi:hypothetical protein